MPLRMKACGYMGVVGNLFLLHKDESNPSGKPKIVGPQPLSQRMKEVA